MKKFKQRLSRFERDKLKKEAIKRNLTGKGLIMYRNNTKGTLNLPKPALNGDKTINPGETWTGDDYFMFLVTETHDATIVQVLESEKILEGKNMNEEKLILDQPDQVTEKGKIEHVVEKVNQQLHENAPEEEIKDALINENPLDGVQILLND